jgi:myo-inositol-1(or 4)-monophosphatase
VSDAALDTAMLAAQRAGDELLRRWTLPFSGRAFKSSTTDEVSDADRAAESIIVDAIRAAYPDDEIVSEEGGGARGRSGRRWLVDPLDGTINWLYRIPQWAVSIACLDADGPFAGVVFDPAKREMFYATRGGGAWMSSTNADPLEARARPLVARLAVTSLTDLALALVGDGFSYSAEERREQGRREALMLPHIRDVRRMGSAALDLAFVAAGRIDAYAEAGGNEWDWAAGRLLVTEAGGRLSEAPGVRPDGPTLIASGPGIHDALVDLVLRVQRL